MKPTRDSAYLTIATTVISALTILITHFIKGLSLALPVSEIFRYVFSFIPMLCFVWLMIFNISILKFTNEKKSVINIFIIYLSYSILLSLVNISIGLLGISSEKIMTFYEVNGVFGLMILIMLVVAAFMLRETEFRLPLRVFALAELFISAFYMLMPPILVFLKVSNFDNYYKNIDLIYLVIPAAGLYIAVTALNIINNQQQPFYPTDKPDWSPYDKPGM